jgi:hypothetical protein
LDDDVLLFYLVERLPAVKPQQVAVLSSVFCGFHFPLAQSILSALATQKKVTRPPCCRCVAG